MIHDNLTEDSIRITRKILYTFCVDTLKNVFLKKWFRNDWFEINITASIRQELRKNAYNAHPNKSLRKAYTSKKAKLKSNFSQQPQPLFQRPLVCTHLLQW